MKGLIRFLILGSLIAAITSCASRPPEDDLSLDGVEAASDPTSDSVSEPASTDSNGTADDFSDFNDSGSEQAQQAPAAPSASSSDQDLAIEDELNQANEGDQAATTTPPAEPAAPSVEESSPTEDPFASSSVADVPAPAPAEPAAPAPVEPTPEPSIAETIPAPTDTPSAETLPTETAASPANITDLKFKANDNGGTIIVQADKPLTYTTRTNADLNQFVIEVDNAHLPERLKRSLNTRDIKGSIGAIDAYQNPGSNTARFVIQLRDGVGEPAVQNEGNSLLIAANGISAPPAASAAPVAEVHDVADSASASGEGDSPNVELSDVKILPSQNLSEFLAGNTKFYGKKISIETANMDIRDALAFITEESGVNMVIAEEVKGAVSLKLRQVPWDQALVVIMKAKNWATPAKAMS